MHFFEQKKQRENKILKSKIRTRIQKMQPHQKKKITNKTRENRRIVKINFTQKCKKKTNLVSISWF